MYLSRLILNPRHRAVQRDLADCQALHRTVMSAFPAAPGNGSARAQLDVLYRLDLDPRTRVPCLLVQSAAAPTWAGLPPGYLQQSDQPAENPACKSVAAAFGAIANGTRLRFRLRANPAKKIDTKSAPDGARRNGRRVELRSDDERLAWLQRKGEIGGFELLSVRTSAAVPDTRALPEAKLAGWRPRSGGGRARLTLAPVLYEGVLRVVDADRFRETLAKGIGPGKAYGLGLLSVAPACS